MGMASREVGHRWIGWHRLNNRQRWRRAVTAESESDCWRLLEQHFTDGQTIVLPAQRRPLELKHNTVVARPRKGT